MKVYYTTPCTSYMFWALVAIFREVHYTGQIHQNYVIIFRCVCFVMHLPQDGHEWPKHVGGIQCV